MKRRAMTYARKRRICERRKWMTSNGEIIAIEHGKFVTLHDGATIEFDHIHQLSMGGNDDDDNVRPMSVDDHKDKTRDDSKRRAKDRRLRGVNKPKFKRRWPKRKLQSRNSLKTREQNHVQNNRND